MMNTDRALGIFLAALRGEQKRIAEPHVAARQGRSVHSLFAPCSAAEQARHPGRVAWTKAAPARPGLNSEQS